MEKVECEEFRRQLKKVADDLWRHIEWEKRARADRGEVIANLMLTYRHLEDASMRLGKAIQHIDGGISVYDRAQVPAA